MDMASSWSCVTNTVVMPSSCWIFRICLRMLSRSAVVFPQPEGPSRVRSSPCRISKQRSSTAVTLPKRFTTWLKRISATNRDLPIAVQPVRHGRADGYEDDEDNAHRCPAADLPLGHVVVDVHRHGLPAGRVQDQGCSELGDELDQGDDGARDDGRAQL